MLRLRPALRANVNRLTCAYPILGPNAFPVLETLEEAWIARPALRPNRLAVFLSALSLPSGEGNGPLLMIDVVFVPIHEGGHLLFRFFGQFISVAGGTFLQLFVPFTLATYFAFQRQPQGTAFCTFFCFEQLLPISRYMADARAQELPLLTVGDPEFVIHDWNYLIHRIRRARSRHANRRIRSRHRLARNVRHSSLVRLDQLDHAARTQARRQSMADLKVKFCGSNRPIHSGWPPVRHQTPQAR